MLVRSPPTCDVHSRDPRCPLNVGSSQNATRTKGSVCSIRCAVTLDNPGDRSIFVLMEVETLGVARSLGWKVHMRCANGYRQETRSMRRCVYRKQGSKPNRGPCAADHFGDSSRAKTTRWTTSISPLSVASFFGSEE